MSRKQELVKKTREELVDIIVELESSAQKEKALPTAYEWLQKVMCNESNSFETRMEAAKLLLIKEDITGRFKETP